MEDSVTLRPLFGRILTIVVWVIVAVPLVSLFVLGDPVAVLRYIWGLLFIAFAVWVLFWRPSVTIEPSGVTFLNLIRTERITWPAIERVDTKFALTLYTTGGKVSAWAAPAPSRHAMAQASRADLRGLPESTYGAGNSVALGDIPSSDSGLASYHVRRYWETLRDSGHLDAGLVEGTGRSTTWHRWTIVVLAALIVATALGTAL